MSERGIDEEAFKTEIRLWALEVLVCQIYAWFYKLTGDADRAFETWRTALLESARRQTFRGLDAAMSDLASAELESAVNRLLTIRQGLLGKAPPTKDP